MKNIYSFRHLLAFLSFFYCISGSLFAQTMPTAKSLPYQQDFSFAATITAYPDGFQGWTAAVLPGSTYNVSGTIVADRPLVASSTAATNSGNFHNYNGKIGFLNNGSLDLAIGFAINATNQKGIQVKYDAMTIRNPYGTGTGTGYSDRINEMALEYRVGTTAAFKVLSETAYQNNDIAQVTALIIPQNPQTITVTLPSECDNQPIVQIRWISKQNSGGGSRPSFAIDNIDIRSDIIAPVNVTGYPKADNILSNGFDFINKIDEIGKTYYVLLASGSAEPTIAQIKAGQDATGTAALQSGFLDITDASQEYVKSFTGLTLNTAYSVFSISEDSYGNVQSTVNKVDATTSNVAIPSLTTTVSSLDLGISEANYSSENLSYQIQASNLTNDVVVSSSLSNFTISKDNSIFASSLTFTPADLATAQTVYVRFTPDATSNFSGQISHESNGATTKIVTLSGIGINPYAQGFDDVNVLANSGWTQYNVAGTLNKWSQTTIARNIKLGTGAVLVNGYSDSGASKDWLISPRLRLNNFTQFPVLSFYSRKFYNGPSLKLMVSTDYDGKSNPETATWTEINGNFPTVTDTYVQSQFIGLDAYKTDHTYVAWVYETAKGGTDNAAEWSIDVIAITNDAGYVTSNPVLDFGVVNESTISTSQFFAFKAGGYGDITLTAPADYQLSLDNSTFQSSIIVSEADALAGKTLYARFTPSSKKIKISGTVTVTGTGLNKQIGSLTGSSLPKADTFDIVTYNLEFFGTDVKGSDGVEFGPTDDVLQRQNVAKVMNKLDADVYVVQEVSDEAALDDLIKDISINGKTFDKTISTSWSYSFDAPDPKFPPQKLVVLYNTQTTTVKNTRVMFKNFYDQILAGTPNLLPGYPDTQKSFFASGRLPYMVQIETNVGGVKKTLNLVDIHARANSGTDIGKYNMRKYDAQVLKDSLDQYYPNSNLIILGDYNDDVKASVITPNPSSYKMFVDDTANYNALTLGISQAGAFSYLSSSGFLDHIMISNELNDQYIENSIAVYDPRADIANYTNTTSDHGPVIARFELKANLSTIDFESKNGFANAYPNPATDVVNIVVKTADDKNLKLRLYDISGRLVGGPIEIKATQESNTTAVQVSNLRTGIYVYTLTENNKVVFKDKIIKK
ncbi:T9SS-dependent choice-of-anchor J family protein [Flavobacterium sp. N1736]|uniref:T9SS-dependent choice-of-anchor J family protein n=1 Tax=Flavobacterium sp. N1736 TaxID=2986823 RepID=UPI002224F33E|nr:T9SS type A sorting domain-containing protein [Flavobacterium sp. N1736]